MEEKDSSKSTTSYYDEAEVEAILNRVYDIEQREEKASGVAVVYETVSSEWN